MPLPQKMLAKCFWLFFDNALFKKNQWDRFIAGTTGKGHNLRHPQMILDSEQRLKQLKKTKITKWT